MLMSQFTFVACRTASSSREHHFNLQSTANICMSWVWGALLWVLHIFWENFQNL